MSESAIRHLCGGSFQNLTGRPATHGFSLFRDREPFNIHWVENKNGVSGRWFFEIAGNKFSAKKITPFIQNILQHNG